MSNGSVKKESKWLVGPQPDILEGAKWL